eukprot:CAMPEP_0198289876 /NCGR_PEP_ID=MMETSP1449-20131203/7927_1 /TAXON_ID=420275 /ORGANISM="Attheya septentrionalis, Strain CCMP2084" /LENGTH=195 /DNA_ID=CAMNT_0043988281 /DNA_START=175 /DNA_END=759 /DNA_ORIENTATION=+
MIRFVVHNSRTVTVNIASKFLFQPGSLRIRAQHRCMNTVDAKRLLGLVGSKFDARELRSAYFEAAKRCHPDSSTAEEAADTRLFMEVTDAYEALQVEIRHGANSNINHNNSNSDAENDRFITISEEMQYRRACLDQLGVPAEVVEESKRCPLFREWLQGKTDAASYWQRFFMQFGGLAPMLQPNAIFIGAGEDST